VAGWVAAGKDGQATTPAVLLSHTGAALVRPVAFRFALDPTEVQEQQLLSHAGPPGWRSTIMSAGTGQPGPAPRRTVLRHPGRAADPIPVLVEGVAHHEMNAWKTGRTVDSPVNPDGSRGLAWRGQVSADVFECASVNAAQALANFSSSVTGVRKGVRKGKKAGFPRFKSRRRTAPAFKLRSSQARADRADPGRRTQKAALPHLGVLRVHGCTGRVRRMLETGRLHLHGASFRFEHGRWWVSLQGVAACSTRPGAARPADMLRLPVWMWG